MPLQTKKPPILNLSALIKGLSQAGVEFIIVGGIAAVAQGAPVTTFDLDIVHRRTDDHVEKLDRFLKSIDAHFRRPAPLADARRNAAVGEVASKLINVYNCLNCPRSRAMMPSRISRL
ncbi:MAG: hypothetical protein ABIL58_24275 [Pseudomonadota bacterium]